MEAERIKCVSAARRQSLPEYKVIIKSLRKFEEWALEYNSHWWVLKVKLWAERGILRVNFARSYHLHAIKHSGKWLQWKCLFVNTIKSTSNTHIKKLLCIKVFDSWNELILNRFFLRINVLFWYSFLFPLLSPATDYWGSVIIQVALIFSMLLRVCRCLL